MLPLGIHTRYPYPHPQQMGRVWVHRGWVYPRPAKGAVWPVSELAPLRNLAHGSVRADPKRQRGKEDRTVETLGSESIHPTLPRAATQPPRLRSALANRAPAASPPLSARQPAQPPRLCLPCLCCPRTG